MKLHIFYRISDAGNPKEKLEGCSKRICLENAIQVFGTGNFHIRADNCTSETLEMIRKIGVTPIVSSLGNALSWLADLDLALASDEDEDGVYFLEDDYLHFPEAPALIREGLTLADYVSLYDHPDKYASGVNPLVEYGGELSRILCGKGCHWKSTNSTTMTFAARRKTLRNDKEVWQNHCKTKATGKSKTTYFHSRVDKVVRFLKDDDWW